MTSPRRRPQPLPAPTLVQTLNPSTDSIVTLAWSLDGHYLAAGLRHGPIILFLVLPSPMRPIRPSPLRTFKGHTADVLHLTFSPTLLLASASMDRTIRLWHPHTAHCLRRFVHPDMLTSVAFSPRNEGILLSAGCDGVVRLWRVVEQVVVAQADAGAVITAASFSSSGAVYIGTYDGRLLVCNMARGAADDLRETSTSRPTAEEATMEMISASSAAGLAPCQPDEMYTSAPPTASTTCITTSTTILTTDLLDVKMPRGRRKQELAKVEAILTFAQREEALVAVGDGRVIMLRDSKVLKRVRGAPSRKHRASVGVSMSPDGMFLLLDGLAGAVRLLDLRGVSAHPRRRDREISTPLHPVPVLEQPHNVSCASLAHQAVLTRCNLSNNSSPSNNNEGTATVADVLLMAVAGTDGSLRIVKQHVNGIRV